MRKRIHVVAGLSLAMLLAGCISAERKAEYGEWKSSDDGIANVTLETFEAKYQQGWRERAEQKKKKRLAAEEAARVLAQRQSEYDAWRASDDFRDGVTLEVFEQKYKNGWRDRAEQKKKVRLAKEREEAARRSEYEEWLKSDDGNAAVDMVGFEKSHRNGWRDRAEQKKKIRLAKERAEREAREAKEREDARRKAEQEALLSRRSVFVKELAMIELAEIQDAYLQGRKYGSPYRYIDVKYADEDWLGTWTAPRLSLTEGDRRFFEKMRGEMRGAKFKSGSLIALRSNLTEEDFLTGEALLLEFGTKYLPIAFSNYERIKERAVELQQVFNENFPKPWTVKPGSPEWDAVNKILEKFARVRTDYFLFHDELCHYWLAWRFGILSVDDLAKLDAKNLGAHLLLERKRGEWSAVAGKPPFEFCRIEPKVVEFAEKYAPESYAVYRKLEREYNELDKLLRGVYKQIVQLDYVRNDRTLDAAEEKLSDIMKQSIKLSQAFKAWNMDHRTMEKSAENVAQCDHDMALQLKPFVESLLGYIPNHLKDGPFLYD